MNPAHPDSTLHILVMHGPELAQAGLDPQKFSHEEARLPDCQVIPVDPALPAHRQAELLRPLFPPDQAAGPVLLVAKDPEHRGAGVARFLLEEVGVNPARFQEVDLTLALEYPDPAARTAKSLEMIHLAAAQVSRAVPLSSQTVPVSRRVLVWGDSYAAWRLAWELAQMDYPVLLASPNPEPSSLAFEYALGIAGSELLASLTRQIQDHPLIQRVFEATIRDFGGVTGAFTVSLATPQGQLRETVGAVVLAPELQRQSARNCHGAPEHPGIISQRRLEAKLAAGAALPGSVAFLVGLAGESHPLSLGRALKAAAKMLEAGSRVFLLVGNTKLAGKGIERALREAQEAGLVFIKLRDCPIFSLTDAGVRLTFYEPTLREEMALMADLVVLDDQYRATEDNARLAELLRLPLGPRGFLQDDNVHYIPVATNRRGIFVVGPARGLMDLEDTDADVNAALLAVQDLLGQGQAVAPAGRAVVDRGKCVLCLTCHRFCPHGAITWDSRAIIHELACQGCGTCASQCPNDAIQLRNYADDQVMAQLTALDPHLRPRIVAFLCRNSAWEAWQTTTRQHAASLPLGFTPIKMPCAGKVDPEYLLQAFEAGADGVMVLSCPTDNCKSSHGNLCAARGVEQVQALLAEAGIDPNRLLFHSLAANAPGDFLDTLDHFVANLGPQATAIDPAHPFWLTIGTAFARHPGVSQVGQPPVPFRENEEVIVELNPQDAHSLGIQPGDFLTVENGGESVLATAVVNRRLRPGNAFLPSRGQQEAVKRLTGGAREVLEQTPEYRALAVFLAKMMEEFEEVFGLKVPTSRFLHRGHTWVALESGGRLRLGMDDFSQKVLGPGDSLRLPKVGQEIRREQAALALHRGKEQAAVLGPVYGIIEAVNPKVLNRPGLVHDDPYGDGWLIMVAPTELSQDLGNLLSGPACLPWMEQETLRLIGMLEPSVGATLQSGGALIDDVFGHYPELGWSRLVKEFLHTG